MKKIVLKRVAIESCQECPHNDWYSSKDQPYCNRCLMFIKDDEIIPVWCPLEDDNDEHQS